MASGQPHPGARHRQFALHLACIQLGFERLNFGVFGSCSFLQRVGHLGLGQCNRIALFPLGQLQRIVQSLLKLAIAHLLEDVGIPRLVDLEGLAAVGLMISCMGCVLLLLISGERFISLGYTSTVMPRVIEIDRCGSPPIHPWKVTLVCAEVESLAMWAACRDHT